MDRMSNALLADRELALSDAPRIGWRFQWRSAIVLVVLCELALLAVLVRGGGAAGDGADAVALIAVFGIALVVLRRTPDAASDPARHVPVRSAIAIAMLSALLGAAALTGMTSSSSLLGPCFTVAIAGSYLALWGFRSLALLRMVLVLSLLTWSAIAAVVHDVVRTSLEQPSQRIYERLAAMPILGVEDEPWRLFTASLHRGAIVVIATAVFCIAITRRRLSGRVLFVTALAVAATLIVHHVIVLASPVDEYSPDDTTRLASHPTVEVVLGGVAALASTFAGQRRSDPRHDAGSRRGTRHANVVLADRDPVIFATSGGSPHPVIVTLLGLGIVPLLLVTLRG